MKILAPFCRMLRRIDSACTKKLILAFPCLVLQLLELLFRCHRKQAWIRHRECESFLLSGALELVSRRPLWRIRHPCLPFPCLAEKKCTALALNKSNCKWDVSQSTQLTSPPAVLYTTIVGGKQSRFKLR